MYWIKLRYPLSLPLIVLRDRAAKYRQHLNIQLVALWGDHASFIFSCKSKETLEEFIMDYIDGDEKMFNFLIKFIKKNE